MKSPSWRKACFFRLNEIAVSNAQIIFQETHEAFQWCLAKKTLAEELLAIVQALESVDVPRRVHRALDSEERLNRTVGHYPEKSAKRGRCPMHGRIRKRTKVLCSHCRTHLCLGSCYRLFHTLRSLPS